MDEQFHVIQAKLKKELDKERYEHTLGVMYTAGCLAMRYGCDMTKAMLAGLLHDCAKCISNDKKLKLCKKNNIQLTDIEIAYPYLIHAKLGAFLASSEYGITNEEICHAIEVHTTGVPAMSLLDKIIYVADFIEPNRNKAGNLDEVRVLAFKDLDHTIKKILGDTLKYLDSNRDKDSIDPRTVETYEYYKQEAKYE